MGTDGGGDGCGDRVACSRIVVVIRKQFCGVRLDVPIFLQVHYKIEVVRRDAPYFLVSGLWGYCFIGMLVWLKCCCLMKGRFGAPLADGFSQCAFRGRAIHHERRPGPVALWFLRIAHPSTVRGLVARANRCLMVGSAALLS